MSKVSKQQVRRLIELQKTEQEMMAVQNSLEQLPDRVAQLDLRLDAYIRSVDDEKAKLDGLQKKYRALESNAKDLLQQVQKSNEKLKAVKTNKEYQSGLKEIDKIKDQHSLLEDEMIACLDEIEASEKDLAETEAVLKETSAEVDQDKARLEKDSEQQRRTLQRLQIEHQALLDKIDPDLLKRYHAVQKNTGSIALAGVNDAVCLVCHVNIPPQMYNVLLRAEELLLCPHCQRMLYPVKVFAEE